MVLRMSFSVEKVAALAYLKLSADEKKAFEEQFKNILGYVDQLQKIAMSSEEAKAMGAFHVQEKFYEKFNMSFLQNLREEDANEELDSLILTNEEATKNAPKADGLPGELLYEVPSIIDR